MKFPIEALFIARMWWRYEGKCNSILVWYEETLVNFFYSHFCINPLDDFIPIIFISPSKSVFLSLTLVEQVLNFSSVPKAVWIYQIAQVSGRTPISMATKLMCALLMWAWNKFILRFTSNSGFIAIIFCPGCCIHIKVSKS